MLQNPFAKPPNTLVNRAIRGDREAIDLLFEDAYPAIYAYCLHMSGSEDQAQELTQEALTRAIINLNKFRGDSSFITWTISIAINVHKDALKKERSDSFEDLDPCYNPPAQALEESLEGLVLRKAFRKDLREALKKLPHPQRQAFILKHLVGLSYEQIAEVASCPLGTVRSRIHNSIQSLKRLLEEKGWP